MQLLNYDILSENKSIWACQACHLCGLSRRDQIRDSTKSRFQGLGNGEQFEKKWVIYCKKSRTRFRLTANHRAQVWSLSQEPESRRLKLNPNPTSDIEPDESWNDLATIHFPYEQITTQYLVLFYHSQLYDTVHETLNLVKQFGLHTSR